MFRLGKRLRAIADLVADGARIADIGSDHAKLLIFLVETGKVSYAVAGEVARGPYEISLKNTKDIPEITVRLANGLFAIEEADVINTIVIAGMGGILISEILEARKEFTTKVKHLILQPNNEEAAVRFWLMKNGFKLVNEQILEDRGKIYEIIVAEAGDMLLNEDEMKFGIFLNKHEIFKKKWSQRLSEINYVLSVLPESQETEKQKIIAEKNQIERFIK
ncbi:tRNA (adenine(22)-N(1))-methyltransferase [Lactovum miscens]|uniref:tRNA (Adenine22-N1)-methyltransferase n=1 Tax=Lactovum miscens TaxID=190387 RepID=A0A841CAC9_9LACT|nr:tRNA (adenine(22)-N(1))-methyltransferase TrmK [Lactovum miscens]MBB5888140.1 tRNA (adenine22-N1)-methyltransferase [Lactovum miscens]